MIAFFTKLKTLWDEKDALNAFPPCHCEAASQIKTYLESQKTMQFLMGLGEQFANVHSMVISMDALPEINKAYSMALRHEKQVAASISQPAAETSAAYMIKKPPISWRKEV
ncbi:conserved hypothetical protein [Ricinus communis]|uniref:Uncharacterized protein n=1 Tax=Ricinus communis TaxID=3988 RepID=B9T773_RICCO|nr:conserved hypothetical protein [Ricinus communis]